MNTYEVLPPETVTTGIRGQESESDIALAARVAIFLRDSWLLVLTISAAVIIPCLWLPHIEAGDEASHLYNAWLVHLIKAGQAPGLSLVHRSNNILLDVVLSGLGNVFTWEHAEKIAISSAVLLFFWGAFALVCATTRRIPWFLVGCLAIFAYGWTFQMGFMNCYISLGLASWGLAILVAGRGWERCWAALLVPLIWMAHPLGLALFMALGAYVVVAEYLPPPFRLCLFMACALGMLGIHILLRTFYPTHVTWSYEPRYVHDGFNQLLLYGPHFLWSARLLRGFAFACILIDLVRNRQAPWRSEYLIPLELAALVGISILSLPTDFYFNFFHRVGFEAIAFLNERLSTLAAIFICCLLGAMKPRRYHLIGFTAIAVIFFFFLYKDTSVMSRTEDQLNHLVSNIPPGQRVITAIWPLPESNVTTVESIDRVCIARCISYRDYEPVTGQFRVVASPGTWFILTDPQPLPGVGIVIRQRDLPFLLIDACSPHSETLCVRDGVAGDVIPGASPEKNGNAWVTLFNRRALFVDLLLALLITALWWVVSRAGRKFATR